MKRQPARFERPMVLADDVAELLAVLFLDRRLGRRPDRGRIVADVVIARKVAAGDGQGVVQALGELTSSRLVGRRRRRRRC